MNNNRKNRILKKAFTLAEILATLVIGSIVIIATLSVFTSTQKAAESVTRTINDYSLPQQALQRIAEDIDNIIADEKYTTITIKNKTDHGYKTAQLIISQSYYNKENNKTIFKEITWQSAYDFDSDSLILYRRYTGIPLEDRLLDEEKEEWQRTLFVPLCQNVTYFTIEVLENDQLLDNWPSESLPKALVITISFAEPFKDKGNNLDVPEEQKIFRTIAVDRTRKIGFKMAVTENSSNTENNPSAEDGLPKEEEPNETE